MRRVCAGGRARTGSVGIKSPGPVPSGATSARSARPVSNEAFRCIRAASSPADSGPWVIWWTQGVSEARPPACRAGALPLSYVSVVVMGGFDPPPRAFQARALPTELHDHGPAPGLEPGSTGLQSQCPSRWARPALLERQRDHAASSGSGPSSASTTRSRRTPASGVAGTSSLSVVPSVAAFGLSSGTTSFSRSCRIGSPPFRWFGRKVSNPRLKDQNLASCHWTTPERMGCWRGQWVPPPLLVGGSHACICQHLDPEEQ